MKLTDNEGVFILNAGGYVILAVGIAGMAANAPNMPNNSYGSFVVCLLSTVVASLMIQIKQN